MSKIKKMTATLAAITGNIKRLFTFIANKYRHQLSAPNAPLLHLPALEKALPHIPVFDFRAALGLCPTEVA
jgi:hypothetical protein